MAKLDFVIKCEGDCERISKVFIEWLKTGSPQLKKKQTIQASHVAWATLFSEIYADEIENHDLADTAEDNVIHIDFNVMESSQDGYDLTKLSTEELVELLEEFMNDISDDDDDEDFIEIEKPDDE